MSSVDGSSHPVSCHSMSRMTTAAVTVYSQPYNLGSCLVGPPCPADTKGRQGAKRYVPHLTDWVASGLLLLCPCISSQPGKIGGKWPCKFFSFLRACQPVFITIIASPS